jgi:predicted DNA-binding protein YlxM (UPF0122 family)
MLTCQAYLAEVGTGTLELTDQNLTFYVKKGFINKRTEKAREISITDILTLARTDEGVEITWRGVETLTDTFVIHDPRQLSDVYQTIAKSLDQYKKTEAKKAEAKRTRDELANTLRASLKAVNGLFDILMSLNGRVDWLKVETLFKNLQQDSDEAKKTSKLTPTFESEELGSAIENRLPEDALKTAYNILQETHEFFHSLATTKDDYMKELHPNYVDALEVIEACYILNDIALGMTVADEKIKEEIGTLVQKLEDLAKKANLKADPNQAKSLADKIIASATDDNRIVESRRAFEEQISKLLS